jgi:hypothetical protein
MSVRVKEFSEKIKDTRIADLLNVWDDFNVYLRENLQRVNEFIDENYESHGRDVLRDQVVEVERELITIWSNYQNNIDNARYNKLNRLGNFLRHLQNTIPEARGKFVEKLNECGDNLAAKESSLPEYRIKTVSEELSENDEKNIDLLDSVLKNEEIKRVLTVSPVRNIFERNERKVTNAKALLYMKELGKRPQYRYRELGRDKKPTLQLVVS